MASSINKVNKNVRFILAGAYGSDFLMGKIFSYIEKENLKNFVLVPGAVYGYEKEKLFEESDIFLYPTYNDCFPGRNCRWHDRSHVPSDL